MDLDVNNNYVPDAWEPYSIENEASKQETVAEHANWQMDWGSPGKQHARNKNYAD